MKIKAFYFVRANGRVPVEEYLKTINNQRQLATVQAVIEKLTTCGGRLPRPHAAHVDGKIWELRTRFGNRIFYFIRKGPVIILLDGHTKKRDKIEKRVLLRICGLYKEYIVTKKCKPF